VAIDRYPVDQEGWEMREVYAKFGVAVYAAQVLEAEVANNLVTIRAGRQKRGEEFDVDGTYRRLLGGTLGRNLGEIRDLLGKDWELSNRLADALDRRNEMIHHFWRRRILKMRSSEGRVGLIEELDGLAKLFFEVDQELTELSLARMSSYGLSREWVEELADKIGAGEDPPEGWETY
jgi:hypothetical protein